MHPLTPKQMIGTRFEVWMEELLKDNGYWGVYRNILYHQKEHVFRQVDIEYQDMNILNPLVLLNSLVILELKYSRSERVNLRLREEKNKSGRLIDKIDTIVNELEERRKFVGARKAILSTNGYFSAEVHQEARSYRNIALWEKQQLMKLDERRRGLMDYFFPRIHLSEVQEINLERYELNPNRVKI